MNPTPAPPPDKTKSKWTWAHTAGSFALLAAIVLVGISHAGYPANKAVPHSTTGDTL